MQPRLKASSIAILSNILSKHRQNNVIGRPTLSQTEDIKISLN